GVGIRVSPARIPASPRRASVRALPQMNPAESRIGSVNDLLVGRIECEAGDISCARERALPIDAHCVQRFARSQDLAVLRSDRQAVRVSRGYGQRRYGVAV